MTERNVSHGIFTIERSYPGVTPQRLFKAFSTVEAKQAWFTGPPDRCTTIERVFDFCVGGAERMVTRWESGLTSTFDAVFHDIVPGERIVYAYDLYHDDRKLSVSLATIEVKPAGDGARLILTEQGAFLDGYDDAGSREHGTNELVNMMERWLSKV